MSRIKVEKFYCLKCSTPVELPYFPLMTDETRIFFDELKEICLCKTCGQFKSFKIENVICN